VDIVEAGTDLSRRSVAELRAKAASYRRTAQTARMIVCTVDVRAAFGKLADRFDALADEREQEQFVSRPMHRPRG
jgi:hypothetical protein